MYKVYSENSSGSSDNAPMYGIRSEHEVFCCFTDNREEAESFAQLLNSENVDSIHIPDLIEDLFYT